MRHVAEVLGVSATGGVASVLLNVGTYDPLSLHYATHQVALTFFTGMAGGLGAIVIKLVWEKLFEKNKRDGKAN